MKKIKKIIAVLLAVSISIGILAMTASAAEPMDINEDDYTQSAPSVRIGVSARISPEVGHGTSEWNSFFNWGRSITESWPWAVPTYLYASATVYADGCVSRTETRSSNTARTVTTEKVYQTVKEGRKLESYHEVWGYWDQSQPLQKEYYAGTHEF